MSTPANKSVIKSFKIIEVFQHHKQALTLNKIAAEAHTSVAAAHRMVSTMQSIEHPAHGLARLVSARSEDLPKYRRPGPHGRLPAEDPD